MGEGAADLAGTDQRDLRTCHTGEEPRIEGSGSAEIGHRPFPACHSSRSPDCADGAGSDAKWHHVSTSPSVEPDATAWLRPFGNARKASERISISRELVSLNLVASKPLLALYKV